MGLAPRCMICHEDFDDSHVPYATRCGHLCCEDCTNFYFSFDSATPCPCCRKPNERDNLIKLFFDYNTEEKTGRKADVDGLEDDLVEAGKGVVEACKELNGAEADKATLDAKLEGVEEFLEAVQGHVQDVPDLQPLLKSLGGVLVDMKNKQQQLVEAKQSEAHQANLARLESRLRQKLRKAKGETKIAWETLTRERVTFGQIEEDLQAKLQSVRHDQERVVRELDDRETVMLSLQLEIDKTQASYLKYKKKYHLYKKAIGDAKSKTKADDEDSLMIVG